MDEYIALGHMERVSVSADEIADGYYIPHHAVLEKFRTVFNGSAKTSNGVALNDTQLTGPQLQDLLLYLIIRFRRYGIAFNADVKMMFRQILVDYRHRKFQRILWRDNPIEHLETYELKTVTYGMNSSPYCAVRVLQQCAADNCTVFHIKYK